ncbi:hypothetical protein LCGC14_3087430 [marine sediment metagenome]|uniref:Uncharacterized protein n=1 Tax=marine sediment metagenome TaxID=412755 RepID=A0A0F8Z223_9ZZZZ
MYGRSMFSVGLSITFAVLFVMPVLFVLINAGTITIEFPQVREINKCQSDFYLFYFLAFLVYMGSLFFANKRHKQLDEREKKITKREEDNRKKKWKE